MKEKKELERTRMMMREKKKRERRKRWDGREGIGVKVR